MASWLAWATMASPIQLSVPAYKLVAHTIHFPLDCRFLLQIHRRNVCRVNGLQNIPPLLPSGDHARVQNSWHLLE